MAHVLRNTLVEVIYTSINARTHAVTKLYVIAAPVGKSVKAPVVAKAASPTSTAALCSMNLPGMSNATIWASAILQVGLVDGTG